MGSTMSARVLGPSFALALVAAALATPAARAQTPSFTLVSPPPETGASFVFGLSADGRSAAGYKSGRGFLWTADGGRNDFGLTAPTATTQAYGISGNGLTVVGGGAPTENAMAFRWTQDGGYQGLGTIPGYFVSNARDANHDGSIVVGTVSDTSGVFSQAFRWTQSGGMQGLGAGTGADAISGDGTTIVGTLTGQPLAMRWTQAGGAQLLPSLGGSGDSRARAVNFDGSIIVGSSGPTFRPTKWINGSPIELLSSLSNSRLTPLGLSDDGSVVAGDVQANVGGNFAGVWTAATGTIRLSDYLTAHGVTIPAGLNLETCAAISSDGKTFAGYTTSDLLGIQGYVATIPSPGALGVLCLSMGFAARRRRE
jgi:uncharacterized membrane protein